jgi:hypothetical protein
MEKYMHWDSHTRENTAIIHRKNKKAKKKQETIKKKVKQKNSNIRGGTMSINRLHQVIHTCP